MGILGDDRSVITTWPSGWNSLLQDLQSWCFPVRIIVWSNSRVNPIFSGNSSIYKSAVGANSGGMLGGSGLWIYSLVCQCNWSDSVNIADRCLSGCESFFVVYRGISE